MSLVTRADDGTRIVHAETEVIMPPTAVDNYPLFKELVDSVGWDKKPTIAELAEYTEIGFSGADITAHWERVKKETM